MQLSSAVPVVEIAVEDYYPFGSYPRNQHSVAETMTVVAPLADSVVETLETRNWSLHSFADGEVFEFVGDPHDEYSSSACHSAKSSNGNRPIQVFSFGSLCIVQKCRGNGRVHLP